MSWRHGSDPTTTIPDVAPPPPTGPPLAPPPPPGEEAPGGGPQKLATWRVVVLGVITVVLVGGLGVMLLRRSNSGDGQAAAPPPAPAPQTTAVTSPAQGDQPPVLVNTGEDWEAIMRSIEGYFTWLTQHPRPDLLSNIDHPQDPLFADSQNALAKLAIGEWHYDPAPSPGMIESVVLTSTLFEGRQVLLFVRYGPASEVRILDRSGKVIHDSPATVSRKSIVTLGHDANDPHWRLVKADPA